MAQKVLAGMCLNFQERCITTRRKFYKFWWY